MITALGSLIGPLYLLAVAIPLARIDLREHRLPNRLVLPAVPITIIGQALASLSIFSWWRSLTALIAAAIAFGFTLLVNRTGALGMGDVKLITAISLALAWFSPIAPAVALLIGFAAATAVILILLAARKTKLGARIPLGPYLLTGFVGALPFSFFGF